MEMDHSAAGIAIRAEINRDDSAEQREIHGGPSILKQREKNEVPPTGRMPKHS